jgi:flagellar biosynthesis protein FlhF
MQDRKVGIVSADNFRMGAKESLELFGRTAGIPVRPAFSPREAAEALRAFADRDLILVDTAGRSPAHPESWGELQSLLQAMRPDEVHLVLSATTRLREMKHQYSLYSRLNLERAAGSLLFTKLDECLSLGCLYNLARRMQVPVSYLCNGQTIPDHILLADPKETAQAVLYTGRERLAGRAG